MAKRRVQQCQNDACPCARPPAVGAMYDKAVREFFPPHISWVQRWTVERVEEPGHRTSVFACPRVFLIADDGDRRWVQIPNLTPEFGWNCVGNLFALFPARAVAPDPTLSFPSEKGLGTVRTGPKLDSPDTLDTHSDGGSSRRGSGER